MDTIVFPGVLNERAFAGEGGGGIVSLDIFPEIFLFATLFSGRMRSEKENLTEPCHAGLNDRLPPPNRLGVSVEGRLLALRDIFPYKVVLESFPKGAERSVREQKKQPFPR